MQMLKRLAATVALALVVPASSTAQETDKPDDEVAKILIAESIAGYSGACACPYSTMSNGNRCGKRSAYSKPGGAEPLCYRRDVTDDMIARYRAR